MTEQADIMLCFQTDDEVAIDMACQYWDLDSEGSWAVTVKEIADHFNKPKHRIANLVRQAAVAYDLQARCMCCHAPREVDSRSDAAYSSRYSSGFVCDGCHRAQSRAQRLKEEEQQRLERERLAKIVRTVSNEDSVCEYGAMGYLEAILAYGIMLSSNSAMINGLVGNPYDLTLCPTNSLLSSLIGRLFNRRILVFRSDTSFEAIDQSSTSETGFSYFPLKVNWQFAKPANGESYREVFQEIGAIIDERTAHPEYNEAVSELWWSLGSAEAERYLRHELNSYRLSELVVGEKMKEAISYALGRFSIPQIRYLLWRVAKNAAALSARRDFTRQHALNTIPGNLIRDCDRALADGWTIKPYCLKWDEEEAGLTTLLFDRVLETGIQGFKCMTGSSIAEIAASRC
jgi:hypothetical protein